MGRLVEKIADRLQELMPDGSDAVKRDTAHDTLLRQIGERVLMQFAKSPRADLREDRELEKLVRSALDKK